MDYLRGLSATELATITTLLGVLFAGVGALSQKLFDMWLKYEQRKKEDKFDVQQIDLLEDKQLQDGLKFVVKKQDRRITLLETKCDNLQMQYTRCMEEHAKEATMRGNLEIQVKVLQDERENLLYQNGKYKRLLRQNRIDLDPSPIHEEPKDE